MKAKKLLVLSYAEECNHGCEEGNTFDKRSSHNHVCEQFVHHFRLTCHSVHSLSTDFTDTDTCTDCSKSCSDSCSEFCDAFYC